MSLSVSLHMLARAPEPGLVKFRLIPTLGEDGACDLQRLLLEHALITLPPDDFDPRILWLDGDPDESLERLAAEHGWTLIEQPPGDLGERMRRIVTLGLSSNDAVILVCNDCPVLDGDYLAAAREALQERDAVVGPAEDGGFVLLGLRRVDPLLFAEIPWGCEEVLAQTCERLRQLGWEHLLLPELWDVDRPEDLQRLAELGIHLAAYAAVLPR